MTRTMAELLKGSRITDYISLGVITKTFPKEVINQILIGKSKQKTCKKMQSKKLSGKYTFLSEQYFLQAA